MNRIRSNICPVKWNEIQYDWLWLMVYRISNPFLDNYISTFVASDPSPFVFPHSLQSRPMSLTLISWKPNKWKFIEIATGNSFVLRLKCISFSLIDFHLEDLSFLCVCLLNSQEAFPMWLSLKQLNGQSAAKQSFSVHDISACISDGETMCTYWIRNKSLTI